MATAIAPELERKGRAARAAAPALARTPTAVKDRALLNVAEALEAQADRIIEANARDLEAGVASGLSSALMDRLLLDAKRITGIANGVREIAALPDPVGQEIESYTRPDGLIIARRRVPLGVVGVIFEEPSQRDRRHRRPLLQGRRSVHPARRQGGRAHQHRARRYHPRRHRGGGRPH